MEISKHSTDTTMKARPRQLLEEGWSLEAREAHRRRVAKDRQLAHRYARGPFLTDDEIFVPSPVPVKSFMAELRRWGLQWDGQYWHRKTTPGREQAALRWARRLYITNFVPQYLWAIRMINHYFQDLGEVPEIRELAKVWRAMRAADEIETR